jgi:hypothetical protein
MRGGRTEAAVSGISRRRRVWLRGVALGVGALATLGGGVVFAAPAGASADVCVSIDGTKHVDKGSSNCYSQDGSRSIAARDSFATSAIGALAVAVNGSSAQGALGGQAVAINDSTAQGGLGGRALAVNGCTAFQVSPGSDRCHG